MTGSIYHRVRSLAPDESTGRARYASLYFTGPASSRLDSRIQDCDERQRRALEPLFHELESMLLTHNEHVQRLCTASDALQTGRSPLPRYVVEIREPGEISYQLPAAAHSGQYSRPQLAETIAGVLLEDPSSRGERRFRELRFFTRSNPQQAHRIHATNSLFMTLVSIGTTACPSPKALTVF